MSRQSFSSVAAMIAVAMLVVGSSTFADAQDTPPTATQPAATQSAAAPAAAPTVYPIAIFPFQEKGKECEGMGGKVTDLLFAEMVANPDVYLVEREDLKKVLKETEISAAGLTDPKQTNQIGQLTGAKILITGSVFQVVDKTYVVAKLIGTESSRVFGASAKGSMEDALDLIVEQLAKNVAERLEKDGKQLMPAPVGVEDRMATLASELAKFGPEGTKPALYIEVAERHVGQAVIDPAAQTEMEKICKDLGFTVGDKQGADILIIGEGFSQFAARHENFTSVKARVELKAVDRKTGRLLAVDRQTAINVDLAELVASKAALQEATIRIAGRLIPAMVKTKLAEDKKDNK